MNIQKFALVICALMFLVPILPFDCNGQTSSGQSQGSDSPVIVNQPQNLMVFGGSNATFSVGASGTGLNYQWYLNGATAISGATNALLTLTNVQRSQEGNYSVTVGNVTATVSSSGAILTVLTVPVNPYALGTLGYDLFDSTYSLASATNKTASYNPGSSNLGTNQAVWTWPINLSCAGYASDGYQSVLIASNKLLTCFHYGGERGQTITFHDTNGAPWVAVVTNVVSVIADMTIAQLSNAAPSSIVIPYVLPPDYANYIAGHSLAGMPAFWLHKNPAHIDYAPVALIGDYGWYGYGTWMNLENTGYGPGGSSATGGDSGSPAFLSLNSKPVLAFATSLNHDSTGLFVSGDVNWSALAALGLTNGMNILDLSGYPLQLLELPTSGFGYDYIFPPTNQTVYPGDFATFVVRVGVSGAPPFDYQWQFNGTNLFGATNSTLSFEALSDNVGNYSVIISNYLGSVTSAPASLNVLTVKYAVPHGLLTNFTFQGDTTYLINSTVQLFGTTVIEGGTVIKFYDQPSAQLSINDQLVCQTGPYRPAILTSKDDDSVGVKISSSTGQPIRAGSATYLARTGTQTNAFRYLRITYAGIGISVANRADIWASQFLNCGISVSNSGSGMLAFHNVLMARVINCAATLGAVGVEHLTADQCQSFFAAGIGTAYVTNSILTGVTNRQGVQLSGSVVLPGGNEVYQTSGGGSHYLATSAYRNSGATNLNPELLAYLRQQTTYAPPVFSNVVIAANSTFSPQIQRDTNAALDLGYHYDAIDYLCGEVYVTNATLTVNAGTVIGCFGVLSDHSCYSLGFDGGARLICGGSAANIARIVDYAVVQESLPGTNWCHGYGGSYMITDKVNNTNAGAEINCQFTDWSCMNLDACQLGLYNNSSVSLRDCQFHDGWVDIEGPTQNVNNCLYERENTFFWAQSPAVIRNHLFLGGSFQFLASNSGVNSVIKDNCFDHLNPVVAQYANVGFNAYVVSTNSSKTYSVGDLIIPNPIVYQIGPLGNFYQLPNSPLINAGSTMADQVGLANYTTQTNQVLEGHSIVDIGFHYSVTVVTMPAAATLSIVPASQSGSVPGETTYNLIVSGLSGVVPLSGFSVQINYDTNIVSVISAGFGVFSFANDNPVINLATPGRILLANSANPQTDLSGQSGSIVLATFTLKGIAAGTSALTIDASSALLIGSDIALPFVAQNGSMSSSGAASDAEDVPLPPWAFGLMAVGILALGNGSDLTKTGKNGGKHSRV